MITIHLTAAEAAELSALLLTVQLDAEASGRHERDAIMRDVFAHDATTAERFRLQLWAAREGRMSVAA